MPECTCLRQTVWNEGKFTVAAASDIKQRKKRVKGWTKEKPDKWGCEQIFQVWCVYIRTETREKARVRERKRGSESKKEGVKDRERDGKRVRVEKRDRETACARDRETEGEREREIELERERNIYGESGRKNEIERDRCV